MRSAGWMNSEEPSFVTFATKATIDCFDGPSFQDGRGSALAGGRPTRRRRNVDRRGMGLMICLALDSAVRVGSIGRPDVGARQNHDYLISFTAYRAPPPLS